MWLVLAFLSATLLGFYDAFKQCGDSRALFKHAFFFAHLHPIHTDEPYGQQPGRNDFPCG